MMSGVNEKRISGKEHFDALAKVAVIGDSSVGKTNILLRYVTAEYSQSHITTIGIDFKVKTINLNGFKIKLQIWDTAGQERFRNLTGTIYQGAEAIILVYAINNRQSFQSIAKWIEDIKNYSKKQTILALVGNKVDLETDRVVAKEEGQIAAKKMGAIFFQASAKDNINVQELFKEVAVAIKGRLSSKNNMEEPPLKTPQKKQQFSKNQQNKKIIKKQSIKENEKNTEKKIVLTKEIVAVKDKKKCEC